MRRGALPCVVVTILAFARDAHAEDAWLGRDKALHFGASATLAAAGYGVGAALFPARAHALALGAGVAAAAGIGKEALDATGYGDPSWKDLAADGAGLVVGLALAWAVDLAIRGVSAERPAFVRPVPATAPHGVLALSF